MCDYTALFTTTTLLKTNDDGRHGDDAPLLWTEQWWFDNNDVASMTVTDHARRSRYRTRSLPSFTGSLHDDLISNWIKVCQLATKTTIILFKRLPESRSTFPNELMLILATTKGIPMRLLPWSNWRRTSAMLPWHILLFWLARVILAAWGDICGLSSSLVTKSDLMMRLFPFTAERHAPMDSLNLEMWLNVLKRRIGRPSLKPQCDKLIILATTFTWVNHQIMMSDCGGSTAMTRNDCAPNSRSQWPNHCYLDGPHAIRYQTGEGTKIPMTGDWIYESRNYLRPRRNMHRLLRNQSDHATV
jgi:hypothetical protein